MFSSSSEYSICQFLSPLQKGKKKKEKKKSKHHTQFQTLRNVNAQRNGLKPAARPPSKEIPSSLPDNSLPFAIQTFIYKM